MKWTEKDIAILRLLYPTASQEKILKALEDRFNWHAIRIQASRLGLVRFGFGGSKGEPKYGRRQYCSKCGHFISLEDTSFGRCKVCGSKTRKSPRKKRQKSKQKAILLRHSSSRS